MTQLPAAIVHVRWTYMQALFAWAGEATPSCIDGYTRSIAPLIITQSPLCRSWGDSPAAWLWALHHSFLLFSFNPGCRNLRAEKPRETPRSKQGKVDEPFPNAMTDSLQTPERHSLSFFPLFVRLVELNW